MYYSVVLLIVCYPFIVAVNSNDAQLQNNVVTVINDTSGIFELLQSQTSSPTKTSSFRNQDAKYKNSVPVYPTWAYASWRIPSWIAAVYAAIIFSVLIIVAAVTGYLRFALHVVSCICFPANIKKNSRKNKTKQKEGTSRKTQNQNRKKEEKKVGTGSRQNVSSAEQKRIFLAQCHTDYAANMKKYAKDDKPRKKDGFLPPIILGKTMIQFTKERSHKFISFFSVCLIISVLATLVFCNMEIIPYAEYFMIILLMMAILVSVWYLKNTDDNSIGEVICIGAACTSLVVVGVCAVRTLYWNSSSIFSWPLKYLYP